MSLQKAPQCFHAVESRNRMNNVRFVAPKRLHNYTGEALQGQKSNLTPKAFIHARMTNVCQERIKITLCLSLRLPCRLGQILKLQTLIIWKWFSEETTCTRCLTQPSRFQSSPLLSQPQSGYESALVKGEFCWFQAENYQPFINVYLCVTQFCEHNNNLCRIRTQN